MRFRTLAVAALLLTLTATGGLAAYQVSEDARGESAQTTVDRSDQLATEVGIRQTLVSDADHDPTRYADTVDVELEDGTVLTEGDDYAYYPEDGEIEFLQDYSQEAIVEYRYDVPTDQVADEQLRTATESFGGVMRLAAGLSLVAVFLFVGGFFARRLGGFGTSSGRGR